MVHGVLERLIEIRVLRVLSFSAVLLASCLIVSGASEIASTGRTLELARHACPNDAFFLDRKNLSCECLPRQICQNVENSCCASIPPPRSDVDACRRSHMSTHTLVNMNHKPHRISYNITLKNYVSPLSNPLLRREQTVYYAKVFKQDLGRGLEILSDILMNSLIDAGAVQRERDVILREMEEVNKQQEEVSCRPGLSSSRGQN